MEIKMSEMKTTLEHISSRFNIARNTAILIRGTHEDKIFKK
jgi:hypothetical protein